jgi:hypothetical protein
MAPPEMNERRSIFGKSRRVRLPSDVLDVDTVFSSVMSVSPVKKARFNFAEWVHFQSHAQRTDEQRGVENAVRPFAGD